MRIRKRFPPPPSDRQQEQVVHCPLAQQAIINSQPFDPSDQSQEPVFRHAQEKLIQHGEIEGNDHNKKEGIQSEKTGSSEVVVLNVPPSSSSHQVFGGWYGEDRAIPIKKRRGSMGKSGNEDAITTKEEKEKTLILGKIMKSKTKKCVQDQYGPDEVQGGKLESSSKEGSIEMSMNMINGADGKRINVKRGSVIMEGSRCSRVNGRGWRCCQQTLVGYSLCEHHLGKGRLRSMMSVRNRAKTKKCTQLQEKKPETIILVHRNSKEDEDDEEEEELVMKKQKKIGMVKARSIRSLLGLGQTDMVDDNHVEN